MGADRQAMCNDAEAKSQDMERSPQQIDITFTHAENRPAVGIRERLDEDGFELVVMGSHGRRGFRRWMLGSVAEATVRYAPCSVVVVHRSNEQDAQD